jgi:hypothetical protein
MRVIKVLSSVALMSVAATATLRADFRAFPVSCSPGAVRSCTSIQVATFWNGSQTVVSIMVRNEQGWAGLDNTGGSLISKIGIVAPNVGTASGLTVSTLGPVTVNGAPPNWTLAQPSGLGGPIQLTATAPFRQGSIAGCNNPLGGLPANSYQTCTYGGWVVFDFVTTANWSANNADIAWTVDKFATGTPGLECETSNPATANRTYCAVTPEPVTMLLVGSGLAGMSGFGFLRRKRGTDL